MINIEMFPAKSGDSFLIRLDNGFNILVDTGFVDTYRNFIKKRLQQIKEENQCIDLLIITHIDEDHIQGAIEFFKENGNVNNPNIIEVKEVWFNSYRHLQFEKEKISRINSFENRKLKNIILSNSMLEKQKSGDFSDISAIQGSTLAGLLYANGFSKERWNKSFDFKAVCIGNNNIIKFREAKIYLLSPNNIMLDKLSKEWLRCLKRIDCSFNISDEKIFDDAYEMYIKKLKTDIEVSEFKDISFCKENFKDLLKKDVLLGNLDKSISNGSSIAFVLEYKNKKILFLGDSHEDIIIENIQKYAQLDNYFDLIKLSHHGSLKNNYNLIDYFNTKKYIISTDGQKHKHPNNGVLVKLLRKNITDKELFFNYPISIVKELESNSLKNKYNYDIIVGNGQEKMIIEV